MNEKVLDIWAIQNNPNEIYSALKNITHDVVIFKNLLCKFKIGNNKISSRIFNNVIYSEGSDTFIMLQQGSEATIEEVEKYLNAHEIDYNIVNFMHVNQTQTSGDNKEFWFARESYVVEDAIKDSVEKGNNSCKYCPSIKSSIIFKYPVLKKIYDSDVLNATQLNDEVLLKISFRGLIEFEDKYILPTLSLHQKNLHFKDIMKLLNENNIDVNVDENLNNLLV